MAEKWNALSTRLKKTRYAPGFAPYRAWRREARRILQDVRDVPPDLGTLEGRSRAAAAEALDLPPGDRTHPVLGPYLAVVEWQRDGTAHVHLATDRPIPHAVVSEAWGRLGGGFVFTSRHRNAPRIRDAEDVGRELGKYLTKAAGETSAPWDAWWCKEGGGYRKTPWRRYWSSRGVGRTIRDAKAAPAVAIDRPLENEPTGPGWQVVLAAPLLEGQEAIPFSLRNRGSRVPECEGHQFPEDRWGTCHHVDPSEGWRCECGPPLKVTDPAAYYAGGGEAAYPAGDGEACLRVDVRERASPHADVLEDLPLAVEVRDGRYYLREAREWEDLLALEAYLVARGKL